MTKNDRPQFVHILTGLADHYSQEVSDAGLDLWWSAMKHWPLDEFTTAANMLIRRVKFMPKASDFEELRRGSVMTATEAWGEVLSHLTGAYREGGIDELTDKAVEMVGGYYALAHCANLDFKRRDFIEAYEDVIDQKARAGQLPLLADVLLSAPDRLGKAIAYDPEA